MIKKSLYLMCNLFLLTTIPVYSSNNIEAELFPIKLYINNEELQLSDDYAYLNYKGNTYVPLRLLGEHLKYDVTYHPEQNVVSMEKYAVGGVAVSQVEAKLFAYETLHVKKIINNELRSATLEELQVMPASVRKMKSIYHVIEAINQDDQEITIYIWCDSTDIYFVK